MMSNSERESVASQPATAPSAKPRKKIFKRLLLIVGVLIAVVLLVALGAGLWFHGQVRASLPQLTGEVVVPGLEAPVVIERDHLGIPTIRAANRLDVARGLGFLHAQERFFQMDLMLRRRSAGEIAALMGPATLVWDRQIREHRFREQARRVLAQLPAAQRDLVDAYTEGVNAGLGALEAKPFEYLVLRVDPEPWLPEDTLLTVISMFVELQRFTRMYEEGLDFMNSMMPAEMVEFLAPVGTEWDAPITGEAMVSPPIPPAAVFDLRQRDQNAAHGGQNELAGAGLLAGSNAWTVADELTAGDGAILANDIHLDIQVPNIWYRASFVWPAEDGSGDEHRITGITLPGTPAMVVGSNGRVAWGFTSSLIDATDLIVLELDPNDDNAYLTPQGPMPFKRYTETIGVAHAPSETVEVRQTHWGPVIGEDRLGRLRAQRWVVHEDEAVNLAIIELETATTVDEAVDIAHRSGAPAQNFHVVDDSGRTAWTFLGRLPNRVGFDGRLPTSWTDGTRRWDGLLPVEEVPTIIDPESGRLWSANQRVLSDEGLAKVGDGGYRLGARARQIRDSLFAIEAATVEDMVNLQLDVRALFYDRWQGLLLRILTPEAVAANPQRDELRRLAESWDGYATADSAGYRMVRGFRSFTFRQVFGPLTASLTAENPQFDFQLLVDQAEGPLWRLVTEQPPHLLDPRFASWDDLLLAAADTMLAYYANMGDGVALADRRWGEANPSWHVHVFSQGIPFASRWISMPHVDQPGDRFMPRAQRLTYGATLRMVITPGREEEGFAIMPGGQSGHPLSPHYRDTYEAWRQGETAPFLPGPPVNTLTLQPSG